MNWYLFNKFNDTYLHADIHAEHLLFGCKAGVYCVVAQPTSEIRIAKIK